MIKKSFRLMLLGAFALLSSVFVACDKYDDDIEGLQAQIDALKATVQSLQSEIDGGAVITNVAESSTGVTVTLSNGNSFTISNGTDGEDGADGTPGTVVEIGENGNWFIDGEDTGIAAAGEDGQLGSVEVGENGHLIINGEDTGIVAAGITAVYENGVVTLYGVKDLEDGYVIGSASHIASLAVVPEKMIDGSLGMPVYTNYLITKNDSTVASNNFEVTYRVNPANANVDGATFSFVSRFIEVATRAAVADDTTAVVYVDYEASANKIPGGIDVTAKLSDNYEMVKDGAVNLFALKAVAADGCEIVSDYAVVAPEELTEFELVNIFRAEQGTYNHILGVDDCATENIYNPADEHIDALLYHGDDNGLDLLKVVKLYENEKLNDFIENHGFEVEYTFSNEKDYKGVDGITNNNKFVVLDGSVVKINKDWLKGDGTAAIDRTPVISVVAKIGKFVLDTASIKLKITKDKVEDKPLVPVVVKVGLQEFEYSLINDETMMTLPWERFNIEVYEDLTLTPTQFWAIYKEQPTVTAPAGAILTVNKPTEEGAATSTDIATLTFDPYKIQIGEDSATVVLHPENSTIHPEVVIKFYYDITHTPSFPNFNEDYLVRMNGTEVDSLVNIATGEYAGDYQVVRVKGKLVNGVWTLQSEMKEFCEKYLEGYVQPGNHNPIKFRIEGLVKGSTVNNYDDFDNIGKFGACLIEGEDSLGLGVSGDQNVDIALASPLDADEASRVYLIRMSQFMFNGQRCVKYFCVEFVRPFNMTVNDITLKTLVAKPDSVCVDSAVVIKDLDGEVIYKDCKVTDYAKEVYNFTEENFEFNYDLSALDATWGNEGNKKLTLSVDEETGMTYIRWYNGGGELQNDKLVNPIVDDEQKEEFAVTVTIGKLAAQKVLPKVTVLSSANSK